ncbi:amidase [Aurantimonas endophytica]|uniref:Asp-tRNA(Asn)/Glu-tRNA(Gln) amidotransferase A subunit family amidase n=1 Tax=Aurantimonas endophytica TaxID=1522175 RepID=A0A7W6HEX4_9HYPH|nr:amidase family protein [Aurantimonas endophytica]MBB4003974.1 Asp-tRNA(Asn)/Glu-tRNA(Gln) amidotransferase A subunit family amidase [Aurantimonas endophytica]MCO6404824.1 amidase [Aurantimonas endophytica]
MADRRILDLPATVLRERLATGAMRAIELTEAVVARVECLGAATTGFAWFDAGFARRQAASLDQFRGRGRALGRLHGLAVAVDDTIDTAWIPTERGFAPLQGRVPEKESAIVERLRGAGAMVAGKTRVAELGVGDFRRDDENWGSPSATPDGAAVAVATGVVPLSVGLDGRSALVGSAARAGVTGYRPSFGAISRRGALDLVPSLSAPCVFAPNVAGVALLAEALFGFDAADTATALAPHPRLLDHAGSAPPVVPTLAFVRTPWWDCAGTEMQEAFDELIVALGERCFEAPLPHIFADGRILAERVMLAEMAKNLTGIRQRHPAALSPMLSDMLAEGDAVLARDYLAALDWRTVLYAGLEAVLERCDAIVTPAATGPSRDGEGTEDATAFNALWAFLGVPSVSLPLLETPDGLPMGVQLVGRRGDDARLLRTAQWLETSFQQEMQG